MTQPLSPAAQAIMYAFSRTPQQLPVAAALRAAADQVVPHEPVRAFTFTNEAIRLNRMNIRKEILAIAAELEGQA